jgi:hypothetical protein
MTHASLFPVTHSLSKWHLQVIQVRNARLILNPSLCLTPHSLAPSSPNYFIFLTISHTPIFLYLHSNVLGGEL